MLEYQEQNPVNLELSRFAGWAQVVTSKFVESNACHPCCIPSFHCFRLHHSFHPPPGRYTLAQTHCDCVCYALLSQSCPLQSFMLQHTAKCHFRILHVKLCLADVLYWQNKFSFKTHLVSSDISQFIPWFTKINLFWTWLKIASKLIPT